MDSECSDGYFEDIWDTLSGSASFKSMEEKSGRKTTLKNNTEITDPPIITVDGQVAPGKVVSEPQ